MSSNVTIRRATVADVPALAALYRDTVLTVNRADYDDAQVQAWAGTVRHTETLAQRVAAQYFLLAEREGTLAGFASITIDGTYIDFLYVHKDQQGKGIATALFEAVWRQAEAAQATATTANVSITARPFFEK